MRDTRYTRLLGLLREMSSVLVAFSGGVDSALLLHAAHEALPGKVLAVTFDTPYTPRRELADADALASNMGVDHRFVVLSVPEPLLHNPPDRCYLCKHTLYSRLADLAVKEGLARVLDGSNVDDLSDYRPGRKAAEELGVASPLLDAGLTKRDIRELARMIGLPVWNKPAGACLLTRLPHGTPVNEYELRRIEEGELLLSEVGLSQVRLRCHGSLARIEVPYDELAKVVEENRRLDLVGQLQRLGYRHVTLDLAGYSMGSLNEPEDR